MTLSWVGCSPSAQDGPGRLPSTGARHRSFAASFIGRTPRHPASDAGLLGPGRSAPFFLDRLRSYPHLRTLDSVRPSAPRSSSRQALWLARAQVAHASPTTARPWPCRPPPEAARADPTASAFALDCEGPEVVMRQEWGHPGMADQLEPRGPIGPPEIDAPVRLAQHVIALRFW